MKIHNVLGLVLGVLGIAGYTRGVEVGTTTPVGFADERLSPGLNLLGTRLHYSTLANATISEIGEDFVILSEKLSSVPNGGKDVPKESKEKTGLEKMVPGLTYVLEIRSGTQNGAIHEITIWEGARLRVAENLPVAGVKIGDLVMVRAAATLASVFGTVSSPLRKGKNPTEADLVIIPEAENLAGRTYFWIRNEYGGIRRPVKMQTLNRWSIRMR